MKKDKKLQKKFTPHHHRHFSRVLVLPNLTFFENIILGLFFRLFFGLICMASASSPSWGGSDQAVHDSTRSNYLCSKFTIFQTLFLFKYTFKVKAKTSLVYKPTRSIWRVYLKNYNFLHSAGCGSSLGFNFQLRNEVMIHLLHFRFISFPYSKRIHNPYTTAIIG